MSLDDDGAREVMSRAFANSEFNPDFEEYMFAGERADEGDRLADVALAALSDAGYRLVRAEPVDVSKPLTTAAIARFVTVRCQATWSTALSSHVVGGSCRYCGSVFVDGDPVHLSLERVSAGIFYPYCTWEHCEQDQRTDTKVECR